MAKITRRRLILIVSSVLILLACIGMTAYLLFSNYQNVRLLKQAQENFDRGDDASLALAETQLQQLVRNDDDNEAAYILLGKIAEKRKSYHEQVYYCYMAHRLNPLNSESRRSYIRSLCFARYFDRLENFLSQQQELQQEFNSILVYAAGRNGNINKYKVRYNAADPFIELAFQCYKFTRETPAKRIEAVKKIAGSDLFLQQELLAVQSELHLTIGQVENAEKALEKAYKLNEFAFAPQLGRFYAHYRSFAKALPVLEKYLELCHDPQVAMQTAEIYCMLKQTGKIARLRAEYQADPGSLAMLCCYYFDALTAFAGNDMATLQKTLEPLRKNITTTVAAFMFFCADLQSGDPTAVAESYTALLEKTPYLDLQLRADDMLADYLKKHLPGAGNNQLLLLANKLYKRKPELFTAKYILLAQKQKNAIDISLLNDAVKRFAQDQGIAKIAIEYYLRHDYARADALIAKFKKEFPAKAKDMFRYELMLAMQKQDFDRASGLFQSNFTAALLPGYWHFASTTMREKDLRFLSKNKLYEPFCRALLLLQKGEKSQSCDILEKADAQDNQQLLLFAARTLAENGRNRAALEKYAKIPADSPYKLDVLLNTAELFAESGKMLRAEELARQAYELAPDMPETQLCYAGKLHSNGKARLIPDIVKLSFAASYRKPLEKLLISGLEARIKDCDFSTRREKIRELCRQLQVVDPDNHTVAEYLKKLQKMPQ